MLFSSRFTSNAYVIVEGADAAAARAEELGATILAEPFDVMDAGRMAVVQDPTGAVFCVWEPRGNIGAAIVNAPRGADPQRAEHR